MEKARGKLFLFIAGVFLISAFAFFLKLSAPPAFSEDDPPLSDSAQDTHEGKEESAVDKVKKNIFKLRKELKSLLFSPPQSAEKKAQSPSPSAPSAPEAPAAESSDPLPEETDPEAAPVDEMESGEASIEEPPMEAAPLGAAETDAPAGAESPQTGGKTAAPEEDSEVMNEEAPQPPSLNEMEASPEESKALKTETAPGARPSPEAVQTPESVQKPAVPAEETAPDTEKDAPPPVSESLLELQDFMKPFIYDPSVKRRNPFNDPDQGLKKPGSKKKIIVPPVEKFPLKDIQLKGIIWDVQQPKALFQLPESQGFYTLLKGDRVGKSGVIKDIQEDLVKIEETLTQGKGGHQEKKMQIKKMNRLRL